MVHKKARCTIERSFGQLKMRFRCLEGKLRIKLEKVPPIIVACFILHNLAKRYGDPDFFENDGHNSDDDDSDDDSEPDDVVNVNEHYLRRLGKQKRQEVVDFLQNNV